MSKNKRNPNHYITAFLETLIVCILTVLPSLIFFFSLIFELNTSKNILDGFQSGEFFLYSVAFSISSFLIYKRSKKNLGYFNLLMIFLASIAYTAVLTIKSRDNTIIMYVSLSTFLITLVCFYCAQVYSNKKDEEVDVRDISREQVESIQDGLK